MNSGYNLNQYFTTDIILSIVSGILWLTGLMSIYLFQFDSSISTALFILSMLFGSVYLLGSLFPMSFSHFWNIDLLMFLAAIGTLVLGRPSDGALLLFLFSLGHSLEELSLRFARSSLRNLENIIDDFALVISSEGLKKVALAEIKIADRVLVKPNTRIPVDGVVVAGHGPVDQSTISGESLPVSKYAINKEDASLDFSIYSEENKVYSGTMNGNESLEVLVKKESADTVLAQMINLVNEVEQNKGKVQLRVERFEKVYVPIIFAISLAFCFKFLIVDESFLDSFYMGVSILIAGSPCALAISTPSAVIAAIARAAKNGVLIKGGESLEILNKVNALALDKTGTITEGKPKLTDLINLNGQSNESILKIIVGIESLSDHPIARAIVKDAQSTLEHKDVELGSDVKNHVGEGVSGIWNGQRYFIGNRNFVHKQTHTSIPSDLRSKIIDLEEQGKTTLVLADNNSPLAIIAVQDVAKSGVSEIFQELRRSGIEKMVMLTGDQQRIANHIGTSVGITQAYGGLLPNEKVEHLKRLKKEGYTIAMIGDGVNDAPALAFADLSFAMGAVGSDVAIETADIALMDDNLAKIPFAISLSKATSRIIRQNTFISIGVAILLIFLIVTDLTSLGWAVVGHEGSTVLVALNALRLLYFD